MAMATPPASSPDATDTPPPPATPTIGPTHGNGGPGSPLNYNSKINWQTRSRVRSPFNNNSKININWQTRSRARSPSSSSTGSTHSTCSASSTTRCCSTTRCYSTTRRCSCSTTRCVIEIGHGNVKGLKLAQWDVVNKN